MFLFSLPYLCIIMVSYYINRWE